MMTPPELMSTPCSSTGDLIPGSSREYDWAETGAAIIVAGANTAAEERSRYLDFMVNSWIKELVDLAVVEFE